MPKWTNGRVINNPKPQLANTACQKDVGVKEKAFSTVTRLAITSKAAIRFWTILAFGGSVSAISFYPVLPAFQHIYLQAGQYHLSLHAHQFYA